MERDEIKKQILAMITLSKEKITPIGLKKGLKEKFPDVSRMEFRSAISELVADNALHYTYIFGRSFLEESINKPVRVSKHVTLIPEGLTRKKDSGILIRLMHGLSFGTGAHPTTRLAINGIEYIWECLKGKKDDRKYNALDIGTGSGILAITAAKFGYQWVDAVDIDACARAEARNNVKLNGLTERISVSEKEITAGEIPYDLVMANLRFPTIVEISSLLKKIVHPEGWVVISGIKNQERTAVINDYEKFGFQCQNQNTELGWCGLVFKK